MLALQGEWVILVVVPTDSQHFATTTLDCDDVWASDVIVIIYPLNNEVGVYLINSVAVVVGKRVAPLFRFLLFDVCVVRFWLVEVYITVESSGLQLLQLVLCLTHDVRNALCRLDIRRTVGYNHVLSRDVNSSLTAQIRVKIDLFERRTRQSEAI